MKIETLIGDNKSDFTINKITTKQTILQETEGVPFLVQLLEYVRVRTFLRS